MLNRGRVLIGLGALILQGAGIIFFVNWLLETDVMFGHYKGSASLLTSALFAASAGVACGVLWLASLFTGSRRGDSGDTHVPRSRPFAVLQGLMLALLLLPSGAIIAIGVTEVVHARDKLQRNEAAQLAYNRSVTVKKLIQETGHEDADVRSRAIDGLMELGPDARAAVPALIGLLGDEYPKVRLRAAETLGRIGPEAKAAVPQLVAVLEDPDEAVREKAREAVRKIDPGSLPQ